ncbi:MAG: branched-chain alpha-keto acid dehydrogenase subunit E2 [Planctomycetota bacterium]|nr:MAG: branched-chain alpha-keto acid dehydrogenase subunit E2 [Planctomycetota bacterium]
MLYEVRVPELGEGVEEAQVVKILARTGQAIEKEEPILEVESNKAILAIPSPVEGVVAEILVQEGESVQVDQAIAKVQLQSQETGKKREIPETKPEREVAEPAPKPKAPETKMAPPPSALEEKQPSSLSKHRPQEPKTFKSTKPAARIFTPVGDEPYQSLSDVPAGPAARKLARELGVDLRQVRGTKRGGRIDVEDIKNYVKNRLQLSSVPSQGSREIALPNFEQFGPVHRAPLSSLRKTIAQRMNYAWSQIPHVYQFHEVDVSDILALKEKYSEEFKQRGSTASLTTFLLKALAQCLKEFPQFNASLDLAKGEVIYKEYFHLGVAVDTKDGLIVPVIRDVDQLTLFEIGARLRELAEKARQRRVSPDELSGACMTLSNLGGIGGTFFTPIINPPEVAILGVGRTYIKPVYQGNSFQPKHYLTLCLSYDHRLIDGADGARFIVRLGDILENFERTLLGG